MTTKKAFLCGALAAIAVSSPVTALADTVPVLAGTNVVTGNTNASEQVSVPATATFHLVSVSGPGRMVGFLLNQVGTGATSMYVGGVAFNECWQSGCAANHTANCTQNASCATSGPLANSARPAPLTVPAGAYMVQLFTDGGTVQATFDLVGLSGTQSLTPTTPNDARLLTPQADLSYGSGPTGDNLYSGGSSATLDDGGGYVLQFFDFHATELVTDFGTCIYPNSAPPQGHYLPECPGGSPGTSIAGGLQGFVVNDSPLPAGTSSAGFYADTAGIVSAINGIELWMSFDGGAQPAASVPDTPSVPLLAGLASAVAVARFRRHATARKRPRQESNLRPTA